MIAEFLWKHIQSNATSFHMPGHKGAELYRTYGYGYFLDRLLDGDITEIIGADNLFKPEGIIAETMKKYRALYGSIESYLLINGSSGGILASVLAAAPSGSKMIMARNCHKSVFSALRLGNIEPVYAYPETVQGISGSVNCAEIEALLIANPEVMAVILPSPNYYGICSDIEKIAEICHDRGAVLIVDQAHGAHLRFFEKWMPDAGMPPSAEKGGADIVINSTHKTLASPTQTAVLNLMSSRVDPNVLEDRLQMVQSTSPSYMLMAGLDINADLLTEHGKALIERWAGNVKRFYEMAGNIEGLKVLDVPGMDRTKLNLNMSALGMSGCDVEKALQERNIFVELTSGELLMAMTGIGNDSKDITLLLEVLKALSVSSAAIKARGKNSSNLCTGVNEDAVKAVYSRQRPINQVPKKYQWVKVDEAAGQICAVALIPYPPGIPLICPGEKIGKEDVKLVASMKSRGDTMIGINKEGLVAIGVE